MRTRRHATFTPCFGERDAAFLAHLVVSPPDFDQVLAVDIGAAAVSDADLRAGVILQVPGRRDELASRLRAPETLSRMAAKDSAASGSIDLTVTREYYLESGDLAGAT